MALGGVGMQECLQARLPKGREVFKQQSACRRIGIGETGLYLEEGDAKGIEVGGGRRGFATNDFGREVLRSPDEKSLGRL